MDTKATRAIHEARDAARQLDERLAGLEQEARQPAGSVAAVSELFRIARAVVAILSSKSMGRKRPVGSVAVESEPWLGEIRRRLLELTARVELEEVIEAKSAEAAAFAREDRFAFLLACCLDRGSPSSTIWTLPYWLHRDLQHLDPARLAAMEEAEIRTILDRLPSKPRFIHQAPATIRALGRLVANELDGNASRLWEGKTASEVKQRLRAIPGVGPGLANLTVLMIIAAYSHSFSDPETIDIKPDVHTRRVLGRLGHSDGKSGEAAVETARRLMPEFPGRLDLALWHIGRTWCRPTKPHCRDCPMDEVCPQTDVGG